MIRNSLRNRIAHRLANWSLMLAERDYRIFINGAIHYGMRAAAQDGLQGRKPPKDWQVYDESNKHPRITSSGRVVRWDGTWRAGDRQWDSLSGASAELGILDWA